jgi:cholesterol 25-hydroxylase
VILTAIMFPSLWQPVVSGLYRFLYNWSFYNLSFFETIETVFCYIVIEPLYTAKFARNPSRRIDIRRPAWRRGVTDAIPPRPRMMRPSRRLPELLIYIAPLLLLDLTLVKKYAGVDVQDIRHGVG